MENFLLSLETEFYFITGIYLEGLSGLLFGLLFFSLTLLLIKFERKQRPLVTDTDISNEIGNEKTAKINLSRSLIEMDQLDEAKHLLEEVLKDNPTEKEENTIKSLLSKTCLLYTSPSPRDRTRSRMPSSA